MRNFLVQTHTVVPDRRNKTHDRKYKNIYISSYTNISYMYNNNNNNILVIIIYTYFPFIYRCIY